MKRSACFFSCLAILVGGIALESRADDATQNTAKANCCGEKDPPKGTRPLFTGFVCLQYLLYDDGVMALWSADAYADCDAPASETFIWTEPGEVAPQICSKCDVERTCLPGDKLKRARKMIPDPVLEEALPKVGPRIGSYRDRTLGNMQVPGLPAGAVWDVDKGLAGGESNPPNLVKVMKSPGHYFAVRLSKGIADFDVTYPKNPAGGPMTIKQPRKYKRDILIGFEVKMHPAAVNRLDEATPVDWEGYEGSPTAYKLQDPKHAGVYYYVTTTMDNAIEGRSLVSSAKPEKEDEKKSQSKTSGSK